MRRIMRIMAYSSEIATGSGRTAPWSGPRSIPREAVIVLIGAALVVAAMAWRLPIGVPGHRGLIWMTALAVVALNARPGAATLSGALGATTGLALGLLANGPLGFISYVLAGMALDLVAARGGLRLRRWLIIPAAGLVHLLALVVPVSKALAVGVAASALVHGMWTVALLHLCFGLAAGAIAYGATMLAAPRE